MADPLPVDVFALTAWLLATSALLHLLMFMDKQRARQHRPRIRERTLLMVALIGGALGGLIAMHAYRHKTRKWRFRLLFPLLALLWVFVLFLLASGRDLM